jgi:hypothetical protein
MKISKRGETRKKERGRKVREYKQKFSREHEKAKSVSENLNESEKSKD